MKKIAFVLGLSIASLYVSAEEFTGSVKAFYVNNQGKAQVSLKNGELQPSCSGGSGGLWQFVFNVADTAAKEWVGMILTARAKEENIRVGYVPNNSGSCEVLYFYFYN